MSWLSFSSTTMSLNIDMNRILPAQLSGVCPKELSRLLILSQSCSVVNPGKMFYSNSIAGLDPCDYVLPSFVGFGMLKILSEIQHRIKEDIDFLCIED